jgi:hypothetical protein
LKYSGSKLIDGLSDDQKDKIDELIHNLEKSRVINEISKINYHKDDYLRFLLASDFDVHKAKDMFAKFIVWRKKGHVDTILVRV